MKNWLITESQLTTQNMLDTVQRKILTEIIKSLSEDSRNIWIKSFPHIGRYTLLASIIRNIVSINPSAKILMLVFTRPVAERFKKNFAELGISVHIITYYEFMSSKKTYDYIFCDDVQDITRRILEEINRRASHVIATSDFGLRIIKRDPKWQELTLQPEELEKILKPNSYELTTVHHNPLSIVDTILDIEFQSKMIGPKRTLTRSHAGINLCKAKSIDDEISFVMRKAHHMTGNGFSTAILMSSDREVVLFVNRYLQTIGKPQWKESFDKWHRTDFEKMNFHLTINGVILKYVGQSDYSKSDSTIYITTLYRSRGFDFSKVFIPFANTEMNLPSDKDTAKSLLIIGMTRAHDCLYLSYTGCPNYYIEKYEDLCTPIDIPTVDTVSSNNINDEDVYEL